MIDLNDFINSIKALSKTNKRLFYNAFQNEMTDAAALAIDEIAQLELNEMNSLRMQAGTMFGVTVPVNVTVNQIKTYLNNWIDLKAEKLKQFTGSDIQRFKDKQIYEAEADGNTVKVWLKQALKIYYTYMNI